MSLQQNISSDLLAFGRAAKARDAQVVLVGPCTPPSGGTTIPFRLLVEYVGNLYGGRVRVFDTHVDGQIIKKKVRDICPALWKLFSQCAVVVKATRSSSACFINGSPRYICSAGAAMVALLSLCGRRGVSVYVAGGTFDRYVLGLPFFVRHIVIACLRRADAVILQTQSSAAELSKYLGNLHVIPNWVQAPKARPAIASAIGNRAFRFTFAGEVREGKGIWELLDAYERVADHLASNGIRSSLEIIGPCKEAKLLCTLHEARETRKGVVWCGPLPHCRTLELLAESDCLVLPTYHAGEGYPGVILESLVRAKPVITTSLRPLVELFSRASASLLVPPRDPDALAQAMISVAEDNELRTRLAAANLELGDQFSTARIFPQLCEIAHV